MKWLIQLTFMAPRLEELVFQSSMSMEDYDNPRMLELRLIQCAQQLAVQCSNSAGAEAVQPRKSFRAAACYPSAHDRLLLLARAAVEDVTDQRANRVLAANWVDRVVDLFSCSQP